MVVQLKVPPSGIFPRWPGGDLRLKFESFLAAVWLLVLDGIAWLWIGLRLLVSRWSRGRSSVVFGRRGWRTSGTWSTFWRVSTLHFLSGDSVPVILYFIVGSSGKSSSNQCPSEFLKEKKIKLPYEEWKFSKKKKRWKLQEQILLCRTMHSSSYISMINSNLSPEEDLPSPVQETTSSIIYLYSENLFWCSLFKPKLITVNASASTKCKSQVQARRFREFLWHLNCSQEERKSETCFREACASS